MEKRYETRSGDLFVRSWARVTQILLIMSSTPQIDMKYGFS